MGFSNSVAKQILELESNVYRIDGASILDSSGKQQCVCMSYEMARRICLLLNSEMQIPGTRTELGVWCIPNEIGICLLKHFSTVHRVAFGGVKRAKSFYRKALFEGEYVPVASVIKTVTNQSRLVLLFEPNEAWWHQLVIFNSDFQFTYDVGKIVEARMIDEYLIQREKKNG